MMTRTNRARTVSLLFFDGLRSWLYAWQRERHDKRVGRASDGRRTGVVCTSQIRSHGGRGWYRRGSRKAVSLFILQPQQADRLAAAEKNKNNNKSRKKNRHKKKRFDLMGLRLRLRPRPLASALEKWAKRAL